MAFSRALPSGASRKGKRRGSGNPIASICIGREEDERGDKEEEEARIQQSHRQHLQWKNKDEGGDKEEEEARVGQSHRQHLQWKRRG